MYVVTKNVYNAPPKAELLPKDNALLKELERIRLRDEMLDPRKCVYLTNDEIAEILCKQ